MAKKASATDAQGGELLGHGRVVCVAGSVERGAVPATGIERRDVHHVWEAVFIPWRAPREAGRPGSVSRRRNGNYAFEVGPGAIEIHEEAARGVAGKNGREGVRWASYKNSKQWNTGRHRRIPKNR